MEHTKGFGLRHFETNRIRIVPLFAEASEQMPEPSILGLSPSACEGFRASGVLVV